MGASHLAGGPGGRAGRNAVVDNDRDAIGQRQPRVAATNHRHATLQFWAFASFHLFEILGGEVVGVDHLVVGHADHVVSGTTQCLLAGCVSGSLIIMDATIDFDDEPRAAATDVDNEPPE
jgi:hypothetical protein